MSVEVIIDDDNEIDLTLESTKSDDNIVTEILDDADAMVIDTVVLDDETIPNIEKSSQIHYINSDIDKSEILLGNMLHNNTLFTKLVKKCLNMENSDGMSRIIHKTLLPIYKKTENSFKESPQFTRLLKKTLKKLEMDPNHKFSHIKAMCDVMISKKRRKKVPFITLATDIRKNSVNQPPQAKKHKSSKSNPNNIEPKTDIIDLENSDKDEFIDLDNYDLYNDVIVVEGDIDDVRTQTPKIDNSNKETNTLANTPTQAISNVLMEDENNLLLPQTHVEVQDITNVDDRIKEIEDKIKHYTTIVAKLEEQEALNDSNYSPYVVCDEWKARIVKLYEELCALTGKKPIKQRVVRLKVTEGHPPGPVRRLEMLLNSKIDKTGSPPFPDFSDVVKCVKTANVEGGLGWKNAQIMNEAVALFTQCGQALRRRRQMREWRDLMALAKREPDDDPADQDPLLNAKLEENRKVAIVKENEVFERFTQMQYLPKESQSNVVALAVDNRLDPTKSLDSSSKETASEDEEISSDSELAENVADSDEDIAVKESCNEQTDNNAVDSLNNKDNSVVSQSPNVSFQGLEVPEKGCELKQTIKSEPIDYQSMLDRLGSDYAVTVFDIEDPFLVIEISSDTSHSDDDSNHSVHSHSNGS